MDQTISKLLRAKPMDKILDRIYIGNYNSATMLDYKNEEGITHILNCTPDPHDGLDKLTVHQININDGYEIPVDQIAFAIRTIGRAIEKNGKILVHCHAGISRSVSLVAAYLMYVGFSWDEAINFIKNRRPQAFPHPNIEKSIKQYFGGLITLETSLLGDK